MILKPTEHVPRYEAGGHIAGSGITSSQAELAHLLRIRPEITIAEAAVEMQTSAQAVSRVAGVLRRKGIIIHRSPPVE